MVRSAGSNGRDGGGRVIHTQRDHCPARHLPGTYPELDLAPYRRLRGRFVDGGQELLELGRSVLAVQFADLSAELTDTPTGAGRPGLAGHPLASRRRREKVTSIAVNSWDKL
jgi:hypothetical protein